jgi:nucleotide-binding universal stress UspA family protein
MDGELENAVERASEFGDWVARLLEDAEIPFEREASLGGVRPDFIVTLPNDAVVAVEAKTYSPDVEGQVRAYELVRYLRDVLGADRAFVVLPEVPRSRIPEGVVSPEELIKFLKRELVKTRRRRPKRLPRKQVPRGRDVFAAMPFDSEYNDVFFVAMARACERVDATCKRIDREEFVGDIVAYIHELIRNSIAVIADLSDALPNVLYEVGYAHALSLPTVHICSTPLDQLPFDVRNWNTLPYSRGQTHQLVEPLAQRLAAVLPR